MGGNKTHHQNRDGSLLLSSISSLESWFSSLVRDGEFRRKQMSNFYLFFFLRKFFSLMTAVLPFSGVTMFYFGESSELKI